MYEEKKVKIPFRDIALQILIIILFILILLWLFPTKKNVNKYVDNNKNNNNQQNESNNGQNSNSNSNSNNSQNNSNSNNNSQNNNSNNSNSGKLYEYVKETSGTYGEYGPWSDWSTNYVAASNTTEVQTDVRKVQTGTTSYQSKVGTSIDKGVIGTIKNNKVFDGYKFTHIREIESHSELSGNNDYVYILRQYEKKYSCSNGNTLILKSDYNYFDPTWPPTGDMLNQTEINNLKRLDNECPNYKLISANYTYGLYLKETVYKTTVEDVYGNIETPIYETKTQDTYSNVTYYRYRTRTYKEGSKDTKWSNSQNDQELLNQGYKLTGITK